MSALKAVENTQDESLTSCSRIRQMPMQMTLPLARVDSATFENFYPGPNQELLQSLESVAAGTGGQCLYFWGQQGVGKTHLLQALCQQLSSCGSAAAYIPLSRATSLSVAALEGLENLSIVCIDDIDAVSGSRVWEEALFDLYNRLRDAGCPIVLAGRYAPGRLGVKLADLSSRLTWGLVYQLHDLDDADKLAALRLRANARGFELPIATGKYLLRHLPRNMSSLFEILDHLDQASLSNQRKLTIPFIRDVLTLDL